MAIVQHTPLWVWGLLALLTVLGLQATRPRRVALVRLLATPVAFMAWGLSSLAAHPSFGTVAPWVAAAAVGTVIGTATTRLTGMRVARGQVELPGSWMPLVRNLTIFALRYALAVAVALFPASRAALAPCALAVSGLSAGYFLGWMIVLLRHYRLARRSDGTISSSSVLESTP